MLFAEEGKRFSGGRVLFAQNGRSFSSYPATTQGGRVFFVQAYRNAHWLGTVSGRVFFVHAGRNVNDHWLGAQRTLQNTLCFCSYAKAHANCLFRKLGHFLHAVVSLEQLYLGGRPPGHCIPHCHWFTHPLGLQIRISKIKYLQMRKRVRFTIGN